MTTRSEFINTSASEKIVLAHVHATSRLYTWTLDTGAIYKRTTDHFVYEIKELDTDLVRVATYGDLNAGTFYFDINTSELFVWLCGGGDPATTEMIVTYRFFFGSAPISVAWDLTDTGLDVHYEGRILSSPGYSHKIGIDQKLTSVVGSGNMRLENGDAVLDEIYDKYFFENQEVFVYSWNRDLLTSDAKLIYRGRVFSKEYTRNIINFTIKDNIYDLLQNVPLQAYTDSDNVNDDIKGRYKRWIYGRSDGLQFQSTDQIGSGVALTGTMFIDAGVLQQDLDAGNDPRIAGVGTSFLSELSPDDVVTIGDQTFTVASIQDDTQFRTSDEVEYTFGQTSGTVVPAIPVVTKNRTFFVADHACAELTKTITDIKQFNRITLSDTIGLEVGDIIEFTTGERHTIADVVAGNLIVIQSNFTVLPTVSSAVIRKPIQHIYHEGVRINADDYTINNTTTCTVTLDSDVEFNLAPSKTTGITFTFTNASDSVTTADDVDLRELFNSRDYIQPTDLSFTTWYEILSVEEKTITLRTNFTDTNHTGTGSKKQPKYIGDDSIVHGDVLGRTIDGTASGTWITSGSDAVKDLVTAAGLTNINTASFTTAAAIADQKISLVLPLEITSDAPQVKEAIDLINKSIIGALVLDNNMDLKYKILNAGIPDDIVVIDDFDSVKWFIKNVSGKNFRNSLVRYRHTDIDKVTLEAGTKVQTHSSDFVKRYVGTNQTDELDVYLYNTTDAAIAAHRHVYRNRLARAEFKMESDLRLEDLEIGDVVMLDFERIYKRFGDSATRKKIVSITKRKVTGNKIEFEFSDFGNTYNSSSVITPNAANDYATATTDEKLKYGYITADNGITDNDEETANINLIS